MHSWGVLQNANLGSDEAPSRASKPDTPSGAPGSRAQPGALGLHTEQKAQWSAQHELLIDAARPKQVCYSRKLRIRGTCAVLQAMLEAACLHLLWVSHTELTGSLMPGSGFLLE